MTTLVAVAVVWRYLYHPRFGLLNRGLALVGLGPIDWLGDPAWAMPAIILLAVWKNFGFNMIIFVAGLQNVPERLYFVFVGVVTMIGYFQLFAEPYVMTQGGPADSTLSVVLLMYEEGFRWWSMGHGAAIAFVLFAIILACTALQLGLRRLKLGEGGAMAGPVEPRGAEEGA